MKLKPLIALAAVCATLLSPSARAADAYPNKPVIIVAPSGAGGGFDFVGRMMGQTLTEQLKGSFIVDNRTGSGTVVGTKSVAIAPPDGYTLLVGGLSNMVFNAALYEKQAYSPQNDFTPVKLVVRYPYVLAARADLKLDTAKDIMAAAKLAPETFTIATAGVGSGQHVLAAAFEKSAKAKFIIIPYKSAQAAYQDLIAGRVDLFFDSLNVVRPHLESKRLKAIFITSPARNPVVPALPTAREIGLPELEMGSWLGLFAPRKTPPNVVAELRRALDAGMKEPALRARLETAGIESLALTPEQTDAFIKAEYTKWTGVIKQAGITAD